MEKVEVFTRYLPFSNVSEEKVEGGVYFADAKAWVVWGFCWETIVIHVNEHGYAVNFYSTPSKPTARQIRKFKKETKLSCKEFE